MQKSKNAFTMIELVFVIVVLGILAAVAIPKFTATRDDAKIATARATVASVRSGIESERQTRLIAGDPLYISGIALNTGGKFKGVLKYANTDGEWSSTGSDTNATSTYDYTLSGTTTAFTYTRSDGTFTCDNVGATAAEVLCRQLVN